ncbi:hypothetical protein M3J09_005777 [Ascochyta lentis]
MSSAEDQQRADAAPEEPPQGAMSFGEFVRSRSNDSEMSMLKIIINRLLENEDRTTRARENIYVDLTQGRISAPDGLLSLLGNDRNASYQRVGFLIGYATAIGLESDILTKVQASFAGQQSDVSGLSRATGTSGGNGHTNDDDGITEASGAGKEIESKDANEGGGNLDAMGLENADTSVTTNGTSEENGIDDTADSDGHL